MTKKILFIRSNQFLIMVFIAFAFFSCSPKSDSYTCYLKITNDSLSFPLDKKTPLTTVSLSTFCDIDGLNYLVFHSRNAMEILYYNLVTQKLSCRVPIFRDGSNGIKGTVYGCQTKSFDSIFIVVAGKRSFIINKKGEVLKKCNFSSFSNGEAVNSILCIVTEIPMFFNNNCFLLGGSTTNMNTDLKPTKEQIAESYFAIRYDLKTDSVFKLPFNYSPDYNLNGIYGRLTTAWTENPKEIVYSFPADPYLHIVDKENYKKRVVLAQSSIKHSFVKKEPGIPSFKYSADYTVKIPRYASITYDKYRDIYYRFFYPGFDDGLPYGEDYMKATLYMKQFSIIILDKDFNVIGETLMPEKTFYMRNYFVAPDGLYLSTSHIDNPALDEDFLVFKRLELCKFNSQISDK